MNLNPKFQVQNQDFAFYPPRLYIEVTLCFTEVFGTDTETCPETETVLPRLKQTI